jgi:hypothetical protein
LTTDHRSPIDRCTQSSPSLVNYAEQPPDPILAHTIMMANKKDDNAQVKTLTDEVDKAEAQLTQSMYATAQLHILWRSHLFRMSLLVLAIAFSQCRTPTLECIKNIKVCSRFKAAYCLSKTTHTHHCF